ncbi:M24 family metallopeptidase [Burkholderia stabilis]|uniref:M24 family metallopeptidase n=1 Tax=Burkholderia stabilis TaxID=95485 RepID=A0A4Q2A7N0_9BURK|nr:M24 family metallopeptidase [Burkholderia stabilis]RXV65035.1 M24 family metallopeptidase [Burkholderia stabilis]
MLKYDHPDRIATRPDIDANHRRLTDFLWQKGLDAMIVTLQTFLTGAPAATHNNVMLLSGFDGSAGFGIFLNPSLATGIGVRQFVLFVDGRYHMQAESQCPKGLVTVERVQYPELLWPSLVGWLTDKNCLIASVAYDEASTTVSQWGDGRSGLANAGLRFHAVADGEIDRLLSTARETINRPIFEIPHSICGTTIEQNLIELRHRISTHLLIRDAKTVFVTSVAADVAYLLNSRGYHAAYQSSHHGILFVAGMDACLFLPDGCDASPVEIQSYANLHVIRSDVDELRRHVQAYRADFACYDFDATSCIVSGIMTGIVPTARHLDFNPVRAMRARKTPEALDHIRDAFARSSRAIADTLRRTKQGADGRLGTELDLSDAIREAYRRQGAIGLSFGTIAAAGANSAIPHYAPSLPAIRIDEGAIVLLDSGAYYDGGFATDCTRVVLRRSSVQTSAEHWQREIHTIALKAAIRGLTATFTAGTPGRDVDSLVRSVCNAYGYDYAHGTGHGIGIHVHERGIWFSPATDDRVIPDAVASIEPGIYIPGRGGVRIENAVIVRRDPESPELLAFENLVSVGYDWDLIDINMLDEHERCYLAKYESHCLSLGTQLTECPLL